jgi:hypothetical protein
MHVQDGLNKIADLIEREGWMQESRACAPRGHCVVTAAFTSFEMPERDELFREIFRRINAETLHDLIDWNDAPERAKEEVLRMLRGAA